MPTPQAPDEPADPFDPVDWVRALLRRRVRLTVAWLVALGCAAGMLYRGWHYFDSPDRIDGNSGHALVDFAGQYLLGRMIVAGEGRQLYDRARQGDVLEAAFPPSRSVPGAPPDRANLLAWMMGRDDPKVSAEAASLLAPLAAHDPLGLAVLLAAGRSVWTDEVLARVAAGQVGGPLYPPVQALLYAPLALLPPQPAYRLLQVVNLLLVFLVAAVAERLSAGRIWCPVAVCTVLAYPGCTASIDLGQNAILSLTLLTLGWWQLARGRDLLGGVCWGLLAYKPVWAMSFLLVPLLTRRWRFAAGMAGTGLALILLTLPFVGVSCWLRWIEVGRLAAALYQRDRNWIFLSRDLQGLPRRWLGDYRHYYAEFPHGETLANVLGLALWLGPVALTVLIALWQWRRPRSSILDPRSSASLEGPGAAFVLLGAWLSCFHFMYYDVLLTALPLGLLLTDPGRYFRPVFLRRRDAILSPELEPYYRPTLDDVVPPPLPLLPDGVRSRWVVNPWPPTVLVLMLILPGLSVRLDPLGQGQPIDTGLLLALWLWCGREWLRGRPDPCQAGPKTLQERAPPEREAP
jgi:hypothetical protein